MITDLGASTRLHEPDPRVLAAQMDEARRFIDLAHRLDAPWVRVFPDRFVPNEPREATIARIGGNLAELGGFARGSGVGVLVESHGEFTDSASLEAMMKAAGEAPGIGLVWDTHHTVSAGKEKPADTWARLGRWVHHTHIKDSTPGEKEVTYVLTGQGTIGVREVVLALAAGGYKGYYGFEWEKKWHPDIAEPEVAFPQYAEVVGKWLGGGRSQPTLNRPLITAIRKELRRRADPVKAPQMRAYMKSAMPYRGVPSPDAPRGVPGGLLDPFARRRSTTGSDTVLALWRDARFREERYAALLLTGERRYRDYQTLDALPLYEELIVTGAWWDYVDPIASTRIGALLKRYPARMQKTMRAWSRSTDMWKRRTAILCQLKFKADTDLALLYDCIEPNLGDKEFFIRKAIGWALRQHAWTDPARCGATSRRQQGPPEPVEHARSTEEHPLSCARPSSSAPRPVCVDVRHEAA